MRTGLVGKLVDECDISLCPCNLCTIDDECLSAMSVSVSRELIEVQQHVVLLVLGR